MPGPSKIKCKSNIQPPISDLAVTNIKPIMPKGKSLSEKEKGQIEAFHSENISNREIARRIGRSHAVVGSYLKNPDTYGTIKRKGRPPKLTSHMRHQIIRKASNCSISLQQLKQRLSLGVSRETIRQVLVKCPYIKWAKKMKAPKLKPTHIERRLSFANTNMHRQWQMTIFSDEKKFTLDGPGFSGYWRDTRKEPQHLCTRNFGGGSCMVWAGFCMTGKLKLVFTSCKMNSKNYIQVLEQCLLPFLHTHCCDHFTFQQDNASIHRSKETKKWFAEHNIDLLDWPARSPDLNPIENLWGILVRRIYANGDQYETIKDLQSAILKAWENIEKPVLQSLISSMAHRLTAVIDKCGNVTPY